MATTSSTAGLTWAGARFSMTSITGNMTTTTASSDSGFLRSLGMATATIVVAFCILALLWH